MIEINVRDNESLEKALRRFKKKWERSGVLKDVKRKSFYEKPSVTKRIARKQTLRRISRLSKFNNR
jgi:small subunit ribosomal protein S21|tara:strand:- start:64 stop:261 length:198 start_codon:yes stop_codon:yes gene_type:complete